MANSETCSLACSVGCIVYVFPAKVRGMIERIVTALPSLQFLVINVFPARQRNLFDLRSTQAKTVHEASYGI